MPSDKARRAVGALLDGPQRVEDMVSRGMIRPLLSQALDDFAAELTAERDVLRAELEAARAENERIKSLETDRAVCCAKNEDERNKFHAALVKIDRIRNNIIGCQNVNWSRDIYPLVAVLGEVGFPGEGYEAALARLKLQRYSISFGHIYSPAGRVANIERMSDAEELVQHANDGAALGVKR
jgi:hypothetical protein